MKGLLKITDNLMKNFIFILTASFLLLVSCEFDKSVKKDLMTGLKASGDGLSSKDVYLTSNGSKISRTSFIYGEKFKVNFENISGFNKENNFAFPGMEFVIRSETGDTLMHNTDLYQENIKGYDLDPLLLLTEITTGDPLKSGANYKLDIRIWDKKGDGTYSASFDFEVVPNPNITIESNGIDYDEIYLFSNVGSKVLFDNRAKYNQEIYILMEGLSGFTDVEGQAHIGVKMKATDASNNIILDEVDLIGDAALNISELNEQLAPNFIFQNIGIKNPVDCEVLVWDKKSDRKIKTTLSLTLEE